YALAGKAGHGHGWALAALKTPGAETVLRLTPEKTVRGRLLDLQGQPAAGVRVAVNGLYLPGGAGPGNLREHPQAGFPLWPGTAVTDTAGKFAIAGLSPDVQGSLYIEGDEFAPTFAEIKAGKENRDQEINLSLAPGHVVEGVVTAADTGKPV